MRGTYTHLLEIARKKPDLARVVDNLSSYSIKSLDALSQPRWIRELLKKQSTLKTEVIYVQQTPIINKIPVYAVYEYNGPTKFIGVRFKLEIESGDLIAFSETCRVNRYTVDVDELERSEIKSLSNHVKDCEPLIFASMVSDMLNNKDLPSGSEPATDYSLDGIFARGVSFRK